MERNFIAGVVIGSFILIVGGYFLISQNTKPETTDVTQMCVQHGLLGMHIHPHLAINIKGKNVTIPANIGIISPTCFRPIHTHDDSGIIHLEFPDPRDVKLSEFFRVWNKKFTSQCIFNYCNGDQGKMKMYVNGKENKQYGNYIMHDKDQIEIDYQ